MKFYQVFVNRKPFLLKNTLNCWYHVTLKVIPVELEKLNRESITPRCVVFFMFLRADKMSFSDTIDLLHAQTSHRVKGQSGINLTSGLSLHSKQMAATKIYANKTETFCVFKRLKRFKSISIGKFYVCWMWL